MYIMLSLLGFLGEFFENYWGAQECWDVRLPHLVWLLLSFVLGVVESCAISWKVLRFSMGISYWYNETWFIPMVIFARFSVWFARSWMSLKTISENYGWAGVEWKLFLLLQIVWIWMKNIENWALLSFAGEVKGLSWVILYGCCWGLLGKLSCLFESWWGFWWVFPIDATIRCLLRRLGSPASRRLWLLLTNTGFLSLGMC